MNTSNLIKTHNDCPFFSEFKYMHAYLTNTQFKGNTPVAIFGLFSFSNSHVLSSFVYSICFVTVRRMSMESIVLNGKMFSLCTKINPVRVTVSVFCKFL